MSAKPPRNSKSKPAAADARSSLPPAPRPDREELLSLVKAGLLDIDIRPVLKTLKTLASKAAALTDDEKIQDSAVVLTGGSVEQLMDIIASYDPFGLVILASVLDAALTIGGALISNPIRRARVLEGIATARKSIAKTSLMIDQTILALAEPLWKTNPPDRKSAGRTAATITSAVNGALKRPRDKHLSVAAIEKRVRRLMKSRTTDQSSD